LKYNIIKKTDSRRWREIKIFVLLIISLVSFSCCGTDTSTCPNIELDFNNSDILKANIDYKQNENDNVDYTKDVLVLAFKYF